MAVSYTHLDVYKRQGIDIAKGDYLGFVDSDDYIDPDMYSILLNNMNLTFSDISTCGRVIVNNESYKIEYTDKMCIRDR